MATTATTTKHESSRKDRLESGKRVGWLVLGERHREVCRTAPRQKLAAASAVRLSSKGEQP